MARVHMAGCKRVDEDLAEEVVGDAGEEAGRDPEAPERDRGVEDGAAGMRGEGGCAVGGNPREHVDQGFAATDDHGRSPELEFRSGRDWQG